MSVNNFRNYEVMPYRTHNKHSFKVCLKIDRVTAQAVSRWLPTAAARVRSCGICGGQNSTGAVFLLVLRFPLPIFFPPIALQSPSSIMWGW
jgi:hypothetical protein